MPIQKPIWMAVVVVLPLWPMTGLAQQGDQDGQAGQTTAIGAPGQEEQAPNQGQTPKAAPDPRSFSGAAGFSAQAPGGIRSYFQPSFQFSEMGDSNFSFTPGPQKFETVDSFIGRLDYLKAGRHSQTTAEYLGGGTIYNHHSNYNTTEQQLGINQTYRGRRWSFMLDERATYMPESPFGSGAFGWTGALGPAVGGAFGSNLGTLNPALIRRPPRSNTLQGPALRLRLGAPLAFFTSGRPAPLIPGTEMPSLALATHCRPGTFWGLTTDSAYSSFSISEHLSRPTSSNSATGTASMGGWRSTWGAVLRSTASKIPFLVRARPSR